LGEKFDIRKFHDQVLGSGSLPLIVLDKKMAEWTQGELSAKPKLKNKL